MPPKKKERKTFPTSFILVLNLFISVLCRLFSSSRRAIKNELPLFFSDEISSFLHRTFHYALRLVLPILYFFSPYHNRTVSSSLFSPTDTGSRNKHKNAPTEENYVLFIFPYFFFFSFLICVCAPNFNMRTH